MLNLSKIFGRFGPKAWLTQLRLLRELGVFGLRNTALVSGLTIISAILETVGVAMILPILDFVNSNGDIKALESSSTAWRFIGKAFEAVGIQVSLVALCIIVVALVSLRQTTTFARTIMISMWKERAGREIAVRCFRSVLSSRAHYIEGFGQGRFLVLLNDQAQQAAALLSVYSSLFALLVTFAAYTALVIITAPLASMFALLIVGGVAASLSYYVRIARSLGHRALAAREQFSNFAAERYRGWRLIKLANTLDIEASQLGVRADAIYRARVAMARNSGMIMLLVSPIMTAVTLACLYVALVHLALKVSVVTLFVVVLLRLIPVSQSLASQRQSIASFGAGLERVQETLLTSETLKEIDDGDRIFEGIGSGITFEDVNFHFEGEERQTLTDVTAAIPANKVTAIIGPSGAGKSTLVSLVPRLELPQSGKVAIDGTPVTEFQLASLRRKIAFVPQNPFLFRATIRDNLSYLNESVTDAEIERACHLARADGFVRRMSQGYDTMLGEDGQRLSGGERQRLVLARALLSGARILILDEPTSALDFESERVVQEALTDIMRGGDITLIIIAHRLSTIQGADHLLVLDSGRIIQSGAPTVLQRDDNWYRRMIEA